VRAAELSAAAAPAPAPGLGAGDVRTAAELSLPQLQALGKWASALSERIRRCASTTLSQSVAHMPVWLFLTPRILPALRFMPLTARPAPL
jgi:hypothetical protein